MALFELTLEELREAFVRTKFASDDPRYGAFGDAYIESSVQDALVDPEHGPEFLIQQFGDKLAEAVQRLANMNLCLTMLDSADVADYVRNRTKNGSATQAVLLLLYNQDAIQAVYPMYSTGTTESTSFIAECGINHVYHLLKCSYQSLGDVQIGSALDCMFWTMLNNGPRAKTARNFVIKICQSKIDEARAAAEQVFNTAVAVSADGTKLVHADEVWVIETRGGLTRRICKFPADRFRDDKILRPDHIVMSDIIDSSFIKTDAMLPSPDNRLDEFPHFKTRRGDSSIYVTKRQFLPPVALAEIENKS